jgi:hypothetical protein
VKNKQSKLTKVAEGKKKSYAKMDFHCRMKKGFQNNTIMLIYSPEEKQKRTKNTNYNLSSKGVLTKYVVRTPLPLTGMAPLHSQLYPAAIRTFAVFSVACVQKRRRRIDE